MNVYRNNYLKLTRQSQKEKHELAFLFLVHTAKLREPEREYRFHPKRLWRLDFAWPDLKIGVEIEGGLWRKDKHGNWAGAHSHPTNIQRDIEKSNALVLLGWSLLRFSEREIKSTEAIQNVKSLILQKGGTGFTDFVSVGESKWSG